MHTQIVIHMQSLDENQFWCHDPGPSLWALIVKHVPGSELPNICTALGHFLVDMYTEVHTEVKGIFVLFLFLFSACLAFTV